jgi:hypothetical protein
LTAILTTEGGLKSEALYLFGSAYVGDRVMEIILMNYDYANP